MENVIKLKVPLTLKDGTVLSEIEVRRPKVKDLRKLPEAVFTGEAKNPIVFLPMIASMSGVDEVVLEDMDVADLIAVSTRLTDFLVESRPIGETL